METINVRSTIYQGADALERLTEFAGKKIWIICDQFLVQNGSVNQIVDRVKEKNEVVVYKDVVPDPPMEGIARGVAQAKSIHPDIMIAYGGGSAIDTAKGILYFARLARFIDKLLFVAIPTTSGTGSEVTSAVVITDQGVKHPVSEDSLIPDEVILCPGLTVSVPPQVTANTGMDVLTHAIEAYVATKATAYSDALAEKACELVFDSLVSCYENGQDLEARSKMQQASNLAGSAFNLAGLGMNHAIAHQIGGKFHVPHGLSNSLLLNRVIEVNSRECKTRERYAALSRKLGLAVRTESSQAAVEHLEEAIKDLQCTMKMPLKVRDCKVTYDEYTRMLSNMARNALADACKNTAPCIYNADEIVKVLLSIY